jgi:hypothetical protein
MYRTALLLVSASFLSACGGEGDSGNPSTTSPHNQLKTLSMVAIYKDSCGNETLASDAALLIHNSDYSNKEIIYADANGKLTYQTESTTQTVSIIMRNKDEVDGVKPVILTTYVDYPVKDMGKYSHYTYATDACDCQNFTLNVNVPARANDWTDGGLSGAENNGQLVNNQGSAKFNDLSVCKAPGQAWPLLSANISFTYPGESFGALIADISNTTEVDAMLAGTLVDIVSENNATFSDVTHQVSTVINGKRHFNNYAFRPSDNVYAFTDTSADYYSVSAYTYDFLYEFPNVDEALLFTYSTEHTKELNKTFDFPLPAIDYTKMFDVLLSESGQYDLSEVSNMDYITVNISADKDFKSMLNWYIIAPISGSVPKIENIDISAFISDSVLNNSVNTIEASISMSGFDGINGYQDYMNNLLDRKVESDVQDKWSRSEWAFFEMTIRDVALGNSTSPFSLSKATNIHRMPVKKLNKTADEVSNIISTHLFTK